MHHSLEDDIRDLRQQLNAVILAHYYQDDDLQDIADFVGDSLDLARKAATTTADVIVFCGVRFMAEGAKILNPTKRVLIPDMKAGCSLEDSCPVDAFAAFKAQYPDHLVVSYINCSAEVKALSDIIVTSTNAEAIIRHIPPNQPIIFAPDRFLGAYLMKKTGRDMVLWQGSCMVHERFSEQELIKLKTRYPHALIIAHPECPPDILRYAHHIGSTSSLLRFTADNVGKEFIVLTEAGIIHQMRKVSAGSIFHEAAGIIEGACVACNHCEYMKLNTMEKLYQCMKTGQPELLLPDALREAAHIPLQRMLDLSESIR